MLVSISIPFEWLLRSVHRRSKNSCFVVFKGSGEFRSCGCRALARDTSILVFFFLKYYLTSINYTFHLENMPPGPSSMIPNKRRHPFLHRNENLCQSFDNQSLSERVNLVLDFMKSANINLPILLWAISWNIPDLISVPKLSRLH